MTNEETHSFLKSNCFRKVIERQNNPALHLLTIKLKCGHDIQIRTDVKIPKQFDNHQNKMYPCDICQQEGNSWMEPEGYEIK